MSLADLVSADWLKAQPPAADLVIVDASIGPARGGPGIPGALRFDIDGALSVAGSAHRMLAPADLQRELRLLGIDAGDRVIAYDAQGIYSSARAWWMLRGAGIAAAVLDGGLPAWIAAGGETAPVVESAQRRGDVTVDWNPDTFVDADAVALAIRSGESIVLDARSAGRYAGEEPEPRPGLRAGHIPASRSLPYTELQANGSMLDREELRSRIAAVAAEGPLITSCGSGVTACVVALAATLAGRADVRVYDGSWAEWGHPDSARPVER